MEKLKLSEVRKTLPFEIRKGNSMDYLSHYADGRNCDIIDYDVYLPSKKKNLQRPFCWSLESKQELILSVLKGIRLPAISVILYRDDILRKEHNYIMKIIDGKQRLSTLISFIKNEFNIIWNNKEYFYKDMELDAQNSIGLLMLTQDIVYEYPDQMISDDNKIAWFEMINFAGTPQDIEHLNNLKNNA